MAVVAVVGQQLWDDSPVSDVIQLAGFVPKLYGDTDRQTRRLVVDQPAMILVNAAVLNWRAWATLVKTSPATRRIPVVLVIETADLASDAANAGVDFIVSRAELAVQLPPLLAMQARRQSDQEAELLACQCEEPLPALALEGIRQFNAGEYYRQHDLLEEQWMAETGPVRDLYRAILQVGVAYYQVQRGNRRGALKMLLRSRQWLAVLPDVCQGVDVRQLRADADRVQAALEKTVDLAQFDQRLLRPVRLVPPPED